MRQAEIRACSRRAEGRRGMSLEPYRAANERQRSGRRGLSEQRDATGRDSCLLAARRRPPRDVTGTVPSSQRATKKWTTWTERATRCDRQRFVLARGAPKAAAGCHWNRTEQPTSDKEVDDVD